MGIKSAIKKNSIAKKIRKRKWKNYSRRMMFTKKETEFLVKNPDKIEEAIKNHIQNNSYVSNDIEDQLERLIESSPIDGLSEEEMRDLKNDMLFWYFAYGYSFNEYLCYDFINKAPKERFTFISDRESVSLGYDLNDIDDMMLFGDKMLTYKRFQKYYKREAIDVKSDDDYDSFVSFTNKHRKFVKKNVHGACGNSIELIDLDKDERSVKEIFEYLRAEKKVILEELLIQSENTKVLNKSSVNTVRLITLNTKDDIVTPLSFMKIGRNGSFVDNGGAGGIFVGVDPKTGIFGTDGADENGARYKEHPETKVVLKGFQLPEWDEAVRICKEMAMTIPSVRWIGWDLAYTDRGWVVVEGNSHSEPIGTQCTYLRGVREDLYKYI